ncbi:MAG: type VI secretion system protein TssA [Gammaproteobacteria bacterium]|nr:type VI secretion system protein TssA [Gammaproteobacteria bacterium]MCP5135738.1 type VI secretion system protein TssA [Gammaproteobacteria bacterium]
MNATALAATPLFDDDFDTGEEPVSGAPSDADLGLADAYFHAAYGINLGDLLTPIADEQSPAGEDLRGSSLYRRIQEARRADDPNLPLGPWEHELKRADWSLVGKLGLQTLRQRSKDLQVAAWVLEAGLNQHGLVALAPGLTLMHVLCVQFWDGLHPGMTDGDTEYRTNLFRWVDNKFPNILAVLPLTNARLEQGELSLGDWRRANLPNAKGRHEPKKQDHFLAALAATPTEHLADLDAQIRAARSAIHSLDASLDALVGDDSPGFAGLNSLLDEIEALIRMELDQRGDVFTEGMDPTAGDDAIEAETPNPDTEATHPGNASHASPNRRQEAYAMLAQAADYLMQTDPHSPVPYLVRQAIAWGRMDTRALYQELFLEKGGQINVFHLLGLNPGENAKA